MLPGRALTPLPLPLLRAGRLCRRWGLPAPFAARWTLVAGAWAAPLALAPPHRRRCRAPSSTPRTLTAAQGSGRRSRRRRSGRRQSTSGATLLRGGRGTLLARPCRPRPPPPPGRLGRCPGPPPPRSSPRLAPAPALLSAVALLVVVVVVVAVVVLLLLLLLAAASPSLPLAPLVLPAPRAPPWASWRAPCRPTCTQAPGLQRARQCPRGSATPWPPRTPRQTPRPRQAAPAATRTLTLNFN
jgi:hypothetical protein